MEEVTRFRIIERGLIILIKDNLDATTSEEKALKKAQGREDRSFWHETCDCFRMFTMPQP